MAYRVCVTDPGDNWVPALNDEVAFRWLPLSGGPHWATATVDGINEGNNVDGSATTRLSRDPKPYVLMFEMDHEPVNVALKSQERITSRSGFTSSSSRRTSPGSCRAKGGRPCSTLFAATNSIEPSHWNECIDNCLITTIKEN